MSVLMGRSFVWHFTALNQSDFSIGQSNFRTVVTRQNKFTIPPHQYRRILLNKIDFWKFHFLERVLSQMLNMGILESLILACVWFIKTFFESHHCQILWTDFSISLAAFQRCYSTINSVYDTHHCHVLIYSWRLFLVEILLQIKVFGQHRKS